MSSKHENKKNKNRGVRVIDILIIIILIIVAIIVIPKIVNKNKDNNTKEEQTNNTQDEKYVQVLEDNTKLNNSKKLNEDKKLDNLELSNIQLTYKDGITNLLCDVKNTSNTASKLQNVKVILRDEQGNEIYSLDGIIEPIQPGDTKQFNTSITADFANAYDFTIVKK